VLGQHAITRVITARGTQEQEQPSCEQLIGAVFPSYTIKKRVGKTGYVTACRTHAPFFRHLVLQLASISGLVLHELIDEGKKAFDGDIESHGKTIKVLNIPLGIHIQEVKEVQGTVGSKAHPLHLIVESRFICTHHAAVEAFVRGIRGDRLGDDSNTHGL